MPKKKKGNLPTPSSKQLESTSRQVVQTETRVETFRGPLPNPSTLQQFDNVVPGAAERIIRMAEQQQEHRQFLEKTVIGGDSKRSMYGLFVGLFVTIVVLAAAVFLIYNGHDFAGAVIGGLDIVGLVSVFVYGTVSRRAERTQKAAVANRNRQNRS